MKTTAKSYANTRFLAAAKIAAVSAALLVCGAASAQTTGTWLFKVGFNRIMPKVSSGNLSAPSMPNTKVDIDAANAPIITAAYMFTDHISTELFLGSQYRHDLKGAGAISGVGKIGTVDQMPPTVLAQYRFLDPKAAFRPYVGLGLTYAMFRKETGSGTLTALTNPGGPGTTLRVDNAWGPTAELGATYAFDEKWFATSSVHKTYIKTTTTLSTGQKIDTRLDPVSVSFSIGYRY